MLHAKMYHKKLKNGLTLIVHCTPATKKCTAAIFVKAGTDHEIEAENGISHFLEHMAFKGTKNISKLDIVKRIELLGADINAYTDRDKTAYYVSGHKDDWKEFIQILDEIVFKSTFPEDEIEKERDVILQEYYADLGEVNIVARDVAEGLMYKGQSYGKTVLGSESSIKGITRDQIITYVKKHYVPNNMVVGLAGDFSDSPEVLNDLEALFEKYTPGSDLSELPPAQYHSGKKIVKRSLPQASVLVSFEGSASKHDRYLDAVTSLAIGSGFSSPLFNEVRENQGLAYDVGAYVDHFGHYSNVKIYAGVLAQDVQKFLNTCKAVLLDCSTNLEEDHFNRAIKVVSRSLEFALEERLKYLETQAENIFEYGCLLNVSQELNDLKKLSLNDVRKNVTKWLNGPSVIVVVGNLPAKSKLIF